MLGVLMKGENYPDDGFIASDRNTSFTVIHGRNINLFLRSRYPQ
jgi:hypothetical protein